MCVVIDANQAGRFFTAPPTQDHQPLHDWLWKGNGKLVSGGKLHDELSKLNNARRALAVLKSAGKLHVASAAAVAADELSISGLCVSNDAHVVALARVSGARLLCSADQLLHQDFGNPALICIPRGNVYQYATHAHLLQGALRGHTPGCPRA
jgi:hypothetical protein